jgi:hypothetical protein
VNLAFATSAIFSEEDLLIAGGVHAIEVELERGTERFVRLGVIETEKTVHGFILKDEDLTALPKPMDHEWRIGRLSPAYGRSELERWIFNSEVRAAQSLLASWEHAYDGDVIAFAPKKVRGFQTEDHRTAERRYNGCSESHDDSYDRHGTSRTHAANSRPLKNESGSRQGWFFLAFALASG